MKKEKTEQSEEKKLLRSAGISDPFMGSGEHKINLTEII